MRVAAVLFATFGCSGSGARDTTPAPPAGGGDPADATADVVGVEVTGDPGAYTFSVSVRSDETGCEQYADWWEVLTSGGALVYRRILEHSHPSEQPFTRTGGPVDVTAADALVVRAHLHPNGYAGGAMAGSVEGGFGPTTLETGFAADLATAPPLPTRCLF
jgi:hypothetical protein